jgi:hypothetical protein
MSPVPAKVEYSHLQYSIQSEASIGIYDDGASRSTTTRASAISRDDEDDHHAEDGHLHDCGVDDYALEFGRLDCIDLHRSLDGGPD